MDDLTRRLGQLLRCPPAVVDRLAVALALAESLPPGDPARDPDPALDDLPAGPALRSFVDRHVDVDDALRRLLSAGRRALADRLDAHRADADATLADLFELASQGATNRRVGGVIEVPVGVTPQGEMSWVFNRESGNQTNSNTRIVGQPGTGKSQFLQHLLAAISARSGSGFLLLDYKGDLSGDGFPEATGATVIDPQRRAIPINPFDLPPGFDTRLAAPATADVIASIGRNFGDVQRKLLRDGIKAAYLGADADFQPSVADIAGAVRTEFQAANRGADSVMGLLDEVADFGLFADRSQIDFDEFLRRRWIIDLSGLQSLRDLVAFVVLNWFSRHVEGSGDAPLQDGGVRHIRSILAIDEAHHYVRRRCSPLLTLLRVGRSKGVPVVLSSQSLQDFRAYTELEEFLPNSFVLKQGAADRRALQSALGLRSGDTAAAADVALGLDQFQALTSLPGDAPPTQPVRLHGYFQRRWLA